jgi:hypothetical protein
MCHLFLTVVVARLIVNELTEISKLTFISREIMLELLVPNAIHRRFTSLYILPMALRLSHKLLFLSIYTVFGVQEPQSLM